MSRILSVIPILKEPPDIPLSLHSLKTTPDTISFVDSSPPTITPFLLVIWSTTVPSFHPRPSMVSLQWVYSFKLQTPQNIPLTHPFPLLCLFLCFYSIKTQNPLTIIFPPSRRSLANDRPPFLILNHPWFILYRAYITSLSSPSPWVPQWPCLTTPYWEPVVTVSDHRSRGEVKGGGGEGRSGGGGRRGGDEGWAWGKGTDHRDPLVSVIDRIEVLQGRHNWDKIPPWKKMFFFYIKRKEI